MHTLNIRIEGKTPQIIAAELLAIAERLKGADHPIVGQCNHEEYRATYRFDVNKALHAIQTAS